MMRNALLLLPVLLAVFASPALAFPIWVTHLQAETLSKCAANGRIFTSNLDSYSRVVKNCDGKGRNCGGSCSADGQCDGSVPPSRVGGSKGTRFDQHTPLSK